MKTLVIDIPHGLAYPSSVLSALKVYAHKNNVYEIYVTGDYGDMSILEGTERISCHYLEDGKDSTALALEKLMDKESVGLVSFAERKALKETAIRLLPKSYAPTYGLFFETKESGKPALLIEAAGFGGTKESDLRNNYEFGVAYMSNVVGVKDLKAGLLTLPGIETPDELAFDEAARKEYRNYGGLISPSDVFKGDSRLIIAGGRSGAFVIQGARESRKVEADLEKIRSSKSVSASFSSLFAKKTSNDTFDPRLDENGYLLFGFGYGIADLPLDCGYGNVIDALETITRIDRSQPYRNEGLPKQ